MVSRFENIQEQQNRKTNCSCCGVCSSDDHQPLPGRQRIRGPVELSGLPVLPLPNWTTLGESFSLLSLGFLIGNRGLPPTSQDLETLVRREREMRPLK